MSEEPLSCPLQARPTPPKRYAYHLPPDPLKTGQMILCCCLNIGTDPRGFTKPRNTSTTYSWVNTKDRQKREVGVDITMAIAANLQRYCGNTTTTDSLCDPTPETIKKACSAASASVSKDRVLYYYNGHGVPAPTMNHECWYFDENITAYVPMSIGEVFNSLGERAVYVFDCPNSERLFKWFVHRNDILRKQNKRRAEYIVFSGYGEFDEPQTNPNFPVDVFTACLTTPLSIALLDHFHSNTTNTKLPEEFLRTFPIEGNEHSTVVNDLYAIMTSITETIAWNDLPRGRCIRPDMQIFLSSSSGRTRRLDRCSATSFCPCGSSGGFTTPPSRTHRCRTSPHTRSGSFGIPRLSSPSRGSSRPPPVPGLQLCFSSLSTHPLRRGSSLAQTPPYPRASSRCSSVFST